MRFRVSGTTLHPPCSASHSGDQVSCWTRTQSELPVESSATLTVQTGSTVYLCDSWQEKRGLIRDGTKHSWTLAH